MSNGYLTVEFDVDATPDAAYAAISNPRGWWSTDITALRPRLATSSPTSTRTSTAAPSESLSSALIRNGVTA